MFWIKDPVRDRDIEGSSIKRDTQLNEVIDTSLEIILSMVTQTMAKLKLIS